MTRPNLRPLSARPSVTFCLSHRPDTDRSRKAAAAAGHHPDEPVICTRVVNHTGHCCDEVLGVSWREDGASVRCSEDRQHFGEKQRAMLDATLAARHDSGWR